jgi:hypothetical protein
LNYEDDKPAEKHPKMKSQQSPEAKYGSFKLKVNVKTAPALQHLLLHIFSALLPSGPHLL